MLDAMLSIVRQCVAHGVTEVIPGSASTAPLAGSGHASAGAHVMCTDDA